MCTVKETRGAIWEDCHSRHGVESIGIDRVLQTLPFSQGNNLLDKPPIPKRPCRRRKSEQNSWLSQFFLQDCSFFHTLRSLEEVRSMTVFRIERTRDYTVMSNHHLCNGKLFLKAKGLLSMILSLPEDWDYTTRGLVAICKEGVDAIGGALRELEAAGYIVRHRLRDRQGRISDTEYVIHE